MLPLLPYFTTSRYRVEAMSELADPKPGEKGADLGSGDGRITIAFAKKDVEMHGFELNKEFVTISKNTIESEGLTNASIFQRDFWEIDLSVYDIIAIYPMPDILEALEEKLKKEAKPGARILTNYYPLPTWSPEKQKDHISLFIKE